MAAQVLFHQLGEVGVHQLGERAPDQLRRRGRAAQLREPRIGHLDAIAFDGHGLVHGFRESPVDELALGAGRDLALQAPEQLVGPLGQCRGTAFAGVGCKPFAEVAGLRHGGEALAEFAHLANFAGAACPQHRQQHREECEGCERDDHPATSRTNHVPMLRGARRRLFPLQIVVLPRLVRSITERFAATRGIHHNHAATSACGRGTESLTFAASRASPPADGSRRTEDTTMLDVNTARRQMIEQQVRAWEVLDLEVLAAMERVRREEFAPPAYRDLAFADMNVPLGHGQAMLAPKLEGRILQALELGPDDSVLEIGTGSGYFAACLAALARSVRSIEIFPDLAEAARANLARTDVHNVAVETADAFNLADADRYDAVVLTGSLPVYDARFEGWLAGGGRLFVVVGQGPIMEARRIRCIGPGELASESLFETVMDPLVHAAEPPRFVF